MSRRAAAAKLEPEEAQPVAARPPAAAPPLALASAIGNAAFARGVQSGAIADPAATRAPWASAGAEIDQALANVVLLRRSVPAIAREEQDTGAGPGPEEAGGSGGPGDALTGGAGFDPAMGGESVPFDTIGWVDWFAGTPLNVGRSVLEITRVVPTAGAFTGIAADVATCFQELWAMRDVDAPVTKTLLVLRAAINTFNNFIGHISYLGQLAADATLATVVGSWLNPLIASLNLTLKSFKLVVDGVLYLCDTAIWMIADDVAHWGGDPEHAATWQSLANGYIANMYGDWASIFVDGWDVGTGTEGQGEVVKQAVISLKGVALVADDFAMAAINWVLGAFNVWGGGAFDAIGAAFGPGRKPPDVGECDPDAPVLARAALSGDAGGAAKQALAAAIASEITTIQTAYAAGGELLAGAGEQLSGLRAAATELNDGHDPMLQARDAGRQALDELTGRVTALEGLASGAAEAQGGAEQVRDDCAAALEALDSLRLPDGDIPGSELLLAPLEAGLEELKAMARAPLEAVVANAEEIVAFLQRTAEFAATQLDECRQQTEELSAKLADADTAVELVDVLIGAIGEAIGLGEDFSVETLGAWWSEVGAQLDTAREWAAAAAAADEPPEPPAIAPVARPGAAG
jgi:hypothetical protein